MKKTLGIRNKRDTFCTRVTKGTIVLRLGMSRNVNYLTKKPYTDILLKILFTLCKNELEVILISENFENFENFYSSNAENGCPWRFLKDGIFTDMVNRYNKSKREQTEILMD